MSDLGPKFSQSVRKRCMNSCAKNGSAERRRFSAICEKPEGGCSNTPRPGAGFNVRFACLTSTDLTASHEGKESPPFINDLMTGFMLHDMVRFKIKAPIRVKYFSNYLCFQ